VTRAKARVALAAVSLLTAVGCGTTGWIRYEGIYSPAPPAPAPVRTTSAVIDCWDHESGTVHSGAAYYAPFRHRKRLMYVVTCGQDGHAIQGRVLGVFHAAAISLDKWEKYSREVVEKGAARGCPAVLVRRTAPAYSVEAQAVGALCVDPAAPAMTNGPLRLVSYTSEPIRILRDDEPYPPDP
jgi:hypothetical protein